MRARVEVSVRVSTVAPRKGAAELDRWPVGSRLEGERYVDLARGWG